MRIAEVPGSELDVERLHYRAGTPATRVRVIAAWDDRGVRVGELWVSMPTLNGSWRARAWPELFSEHVSGRVGAALVNAHVRTISRVAVVAWARGTGVGAGLVRAYLRDPITPLTESLASMGKYLPLYESAGMRRVECAETRRDAVWRAALASAGVEAWEMVDVRRASHVLRRHRALREAVVAWARGSKATRACIERGGTDLSAIAARAACGLVAGRRVYVSP